MLLFKRYIYLLLFLSFFLNWLAIGDDSRAYISLNLIPKNSILLIELLSFILLLVFLKKRIYLTEKLLIYISVFIFINIGILFYFNGSIINLLIGIRKYFGFIPIFIAGFYLSLKNREIKPFLLILLIFCLFQVPVVIFQFMSSGKHITGNVDFVTGTMGGYGSNLLSGILASAICFLLGFSINTQKKVKYLFYLMIFLLVGVMGLTISRGSIVYFMVLAIFFLFKVRYKLKHKILVFLLIAICLLFFTNIYANIMNYKVNIFSFDYYYNLLFFKEQGFYSDDLYRLTRVEAIVYSLNTISENGVSFFWGTGIGNATRNSSSIGSDGRFFSHHTIRNFYNILILESGIVGLLLFFYILIFLYKKVNYIIKNSDNNIMLKRVGLSYLGVLWLIVLFAFHSDTITRIQFSYPFFFITGYLICEYYKIKKLQKKEKMIYNNCR